MASSTERKGWLSTSSATCSLVDVFGRIMQEDKNYCVYLHRNKKTNEVFYVGSGRPKRAQEKAQRGPNWKIIADSDGFVSEIVKDNLSKDELNHYLRTGEK